MLKLFVKAQMLKNDIAGATAIEYGLIAAGIAIAIMAVVFTLGEELQGMFEDVTTQLGTREGGV